MFWGLNGGVWFLWRKQVDVVESYFLDMTLGSHTKIQS